MTSVPIEILGKALAESIERERKPCAHGFAGDCPTCAHFAKVREAELRVPDPDHLSGHTLRTFPPELRYKT
jgi:hypothetical protein